MDAHKNVRGTDTHTDISESDRTLNGSEKTLKVLKALEWQCARFAVGEWFEWFYRFSVAV